ncbi:unnamed protein product [Lactuca virosa]|uniref:Uncharacterized protein n=1 Tax=Lactuca virosa TaxID=75947 RepID=A0AAU9P316_9ASTR|nr:unnamed protein product [Lactuca virosa]
MFPPSTNVPPLCLRPRTILVQTPTTVIRSYQTVVSCFHRCSATSLSNFLPLKINNVSLSNKKARRTNPELGTSLSLNQI